MALRLKVCGMKYNAGEVSELQPDYLGFIFWKPSSRYFRGVIPTLPGGVKKVGVFVDAPAAEISEAVNTHGLDVVQLHGAESAQYCDKLKSNWPSNQSPIEIIKVFAIKDTFDFGILEAYEPYCDYFLFDTKGKLPGGNGYAFDWNVLNGYSSTKPYFLSGGIGPENAADIVEFLNRPESKYCHAIDVNSRFETKPGIKDIKKLKEFKKALWEKKK